MRRGLPLLLLLAGCAGSATLSASEQAPDLPLTSLEGKSIRTASLWSGNQVLLVFMTTW